MKICDLTQSYTGEGGGVRTFLHAERRHILERTGDEHVLIVPGAADATERRERAVVHTVASPPVPGSPGYRLFVRSGRALDLLRAECPDVVAVHCAYNLPWAAFRHRRRRPCAVVGFFHTDLPAAYVEPPAARLFGARAGRALRRGAERYLRALYARCDAVVATTPEMAARLGEIGVRGVELVPLGVDLDTFHPSRRDPEIRRRFGVGEGGLLLVYAGRLDREKRPHFLLDAFEQLGPGFPATLVLVGAGPQRDALAARGRAIGRVHVLPFEHDRDRLAALLASADVYVSAMAHETFGLAVVEAQACGLPVVGVRAGAMVDRVVPGTGFLADPDSPADMARILAGTPAGAWRGMGRAARAHAEAGFSWARTFDRLLALYRETAARAARERAGPPGAARTAAGVRG